MVWWGGKPYVSACVWLPYPLMIITMDKPSSNTSLEKTAVGTSGVSRAHMITSMLPASAEDRAVRPRGLILPKNLTIRGQKPRVGVEYRKQESQRVMDSPSLDAKFPHLKSLTVNLEYFGGQTARKGSSVKYTVNVAHAKSVLRFKCPNAECLCGDFDLSEKLGAAITARRANLVGELRCQGWRNKDTVDQLRCHTLLRFEISLGYKRKTRARAD
jgi:hypothetical protein